MLQGILDETIIKRRGTALIVDDEPSSRMILSKMLTNIGFDVTEANNGVECIAQVFLCIPDFVFMDISMPEMDGYEATSKIRMMFGEVYIPIIMLTSMSDEKSIARGIESGADDLLHKPFNKAILSSKIIGLERIRDLVTKVRRLRARREEDEYQARQIYDNYLTSRNVVTDRVQSNIVHTDIFGGDVTLTSWSPCGDLYVLLGDFTGHGLMAAIGALPVADIFFSMTRKGFIAADILNEINNKLLKLLPSNIFMAAQFVVINDRKKTLSIINCGMPSAFIVNSVGKCIKQYFESSCLPLGLVERINFRRVVENYAIEDGDNFVMISDGVTEAKGDKGIEFSTEGVVNAVMSIDDFSAIINAIKETLLVFTGVEKQIDDMSIVAIQCNQSKFKKDYSIYDHVIEKEKLVNGPTELFEEDRYHIRNNLERYIVGAELMRSDPIPQIINYFDPMLLDKEFSHQLSVILTELYENALDHGVLLLDSSQRATEEGYAKYYRNREKRLQEITTGFVKISVSEIYNKSGSEWSVVVTDSGNGFDWKSIGLEKAKLTANYGRGISLLRSICDELTYNTIGNSATARFIHMQN
ncbi:MAG: SpoIIE family protein phosphatase [Ectothiorhodospiraceae bacterium]|nr:SpoIIE family protein phosphatase [Ectothiorhodospiraceae bacterium]